ncbi:MAG: hypothetical protein MI723_07240 [Caulobacterales bacterium]|nr:hypothetical protein [Caulobacterales bacterium]
MTRMTALRHIAALAAVLTLAQAGPVSAQSPRDESITEFVVADVVRLREAPRSDASIIAHLRIATPVLIIEEEDAGPRYDGWTKIAPRANPAIRGYVSAGLVSARRPSAIDLQEDLDATLAAGDFDGALVAAERLHALRPEDRLVTLDLIEILRARGETARADTNLAALTGDAAKHLVYCRTSDWKAFEGPYMVASHAPRAERGAARAEGLPAGDEPGWLLSAEPRNAPYVVDLQKAPWYADGGGLLSRPDASSWALTPGIRFDARMEPRAIPPLSPDARTACPQPGLLRSNEPFVKVPLRTVRVEPLAPALAAAPRLGPLADRASRVHAARVPYADRFISVSLAFDRREVCRGCRAVPEELVFHALYDEATDTVLAQRGGIIAVAREDPAIIHVTAVRWGRWSSSGDTFAIVEWENTTDGPGGGAFVDWMVFDANGFVDGATFVIEAWRGLRREEG